MDSTIPYEVLSAEPVDAIRTKVKVQVKSAIVVNGYGGGTHTFDVMNDTIIEDIERQISWKFSNAPHAEAAAPLAFAAKTNVIADLIQVAEGKKEAKRQEIAKKKEDQAIQDLIDGQREAEERERQRLADEAEEARVRADEARVAAENARLAEEARAAEEARVKAEADAKTAEEAANVEVEKPAEPVLGEEAQPIQPVLGEEAQPAQPISGGLDLGAPAEKVS